MIQRLLLHPSDQPLFSIAFRSAGCVVDLAVNDVSIFREAAGTSTNFTMPINEWLFHEGNEIRLQCTSLGEKVAQAEATVTYRRLRQPLKNTVPLLSLTWNEEIARRSATGEGPPWEPDPERSPAIATLGVETEFIWARRPTRRQSNGVTFLTATFALPRPWPVCPWQEGAILADQPNLKYSVRQLIQESWGILARRDQATIQRLTATRAQCLESAYHLGTTEVEEAMLFPRLLQSHDWQMAPLREEGWQLEIAGQGRLARMVDERTGGSVLRLVNERAALEAEIEVWWAFTDRWVLTR